MFEFAKVAKVKVSEALVKTQEQITFMKKQIVRLQIMQVDLNQQSSSVKVQKLQEQLKMQQVQQHELSTIIYNTKEQKSFDGRAKTAQLKELAEIKERQEQLKILLDNLVAPVKKEEQLVIPEQLPLKEVGQNVQNKMIVLNMPPKVCKVNQLSNQTATPRRDDIARLLKSGNIGLTYGDINGSSKLLVSMLDHYGVLQFKNPEKRAEYMALDFQALGYAKKGTYGLINPPTGDKGKKSIMSALEIIKQDMEKGEASECIVRGLGDDVGDINGHDLMILQVYSQLKNQRILLSDHFGFVEDGPLTIKNNEKYSQAYSNYGEIIAVTLDVTGVSKSEYIELMQRVYRPKSKLIDYTVVYDDQGRKKIDIYCHGHCNTDTIQEVLDDLKIAHGNINLQTVDGLIQAIDDINNKILNMKPKEFSQFMFGAMQVYHANTNLDPKSRMTGALALVGNGYQRSDINEKSPIHLVLRGHDHQTYVGDFDLSLDVDSYALPNALSGVPPVKFTLEKYDLDMTDEDKQMANMLLALVNMYEDATDEVTSIGTTLENCNFSQWVWQGNNEKIANYEKANKIDDIIQENQAKTGQLKLLADCAASLRQRYIEINEKINNLLEINKQKQAEQLNYKQVK